MSEWQPIETADIKPFSPDGNWWEGTARLLLCNRYHVVVGRYAYTSRGKGRWLSAGHIFEPTHWMPLPKPPTPPEVK